jgi:hypothetical protein
MRRNLSHMGWFPMSMPKVSLKTLTHGLVESAAPAEPELSFLTASYEFATMTRRLPNRIWKMGAL